MYKKTLFLLLVFFSFGVHARSPKDLTASSKRKTICLSMIIKNESEVIEKCLGSVKHLIDYWVIFDTGSTDGSQEIVRNFLKDIPGELHESPWVNFAHNRNEALTLAKDKADYSFFIDADEVLQYSDDFALPALDKDYYLMSVRQLNAADCKRIGLINNHLDWNWQGVLHEVVQCPQAKSCGHLRNVVNICNASQGARAKDPERGLKDALVLEKALEADPQNSRYAYYLAVSYLAADKYELALKNFKKRVSMNSADVQETYMSIYHTGIAQEKLMDYTSSLESFYQAYAFRPTRAEPLFRIATIYRKRGEYLLGYLVSKYALSIPNPTNDLCVEYMTYDYALLIEFANCALLLGKYEEGLQACNQLLSNPDLPSDIKPNVLSNQALASQNVYRKD